MRLIGCLIAFESLRIARLIMDVEKGNIHSREHLHELHRDMTWEQDHSSTTKRPWNLPLTDFFYEGWKVSYAIRPLSYKLQRVAKKKKNCRYGVPRVRARVNSRFHEEIFTSKSFRNVLVEKTSVCSVSMTNLFHVCPHYYSTTFYYIF